MLTKLLKWSGVVLGSLILLAAVVYTFIYFNTRNRVNKIYEVRLQKLSIPTDSISPAKGKHIAEIRGCISCHGADLSGGAAFADAKSPLGILYSSNITHGKGGPSYDDADWIRALRHGLANPIYPT
jgi:mono/diheme cytochrome c family protein